MCVGVGGGGGYILDGFLSLLAKRIGCASIAYDAYLSMFPRTPDNRHRGSPEGEYPPRAIPSTRSKHRVGVGATARSSDFCSL